METEKNPHEKPTTVTPYTIVNDPQAKAQISQIGQNIFNQSPVVIAIKNGDFEALANKATKEEREAHYQRLVALNDDAVKEEFTHASDEDVKAAAARVMNERGLDTSTQ